MVEKSNHVDKPNHVIKRCIYETISRAGRKGMILACKIQVWKYVPKDLLTPIGIKEYDVSMYC
jgi:hypothetical protein